MDLLEYQAKELFREIGIPVLPAQRIDDPGDIKRLEIPYPVVLKSQVPAGGRGKAGGIRLVENTIDAIAAARAIFNLPILGKYPQVLLAESHYDTEREFYLAVILDYGLGRPVLLGSAQGGVHVELVMSNMQRVVIDQDFSLFYARRLMVKMGLQGHLIESVSAIVQKMYQLFVRNDLDLVEINPLGISSTGELMALDGKITVNDSALSRHSELLTLGLTPDPRVNGAVQTRQPRQLNWTETEGTIGIICNSSCLAAATLDLIYQANGKPAKCLVVENYPDGDVSSVASAVQPLQTALQQMTQTKGINVILVNILSSTAASEPIAEVIAHYCLSQGGEHPAWGVLERIERPTGVLSRTRRRERNSSRRSTGKKTLSVSQVPNMVIRIVGGKLDGIQESLAPFPVHWIDNLDQAVSQAVSLAKTARKSSSDHRKK